MMKHIAGLSRTEIDIPDVGLVVDIGSGHNPHPRANVLLDFETGETKHRSGEKADISGKDFVLGDIQYLPFKKGAFVFSICSHVLEHLDDPVLACKELERVSSAGYVETPSALFETIMGEPFHKWLIEERGGALVFRPKKEHQPLGDIFYKQYYHERKRHGKDYTTKLSVFERKLTRSALRLIKKFPLIGRPIRKLVIHRDDLKWDVAEAIESRPDLIFCRKEWKRGELNVIIDSC